MRVTRLVFGAGESGCFPGLARLFRTHLTSEERNSAEGVKAAAARWGAAITPALMAALYAWFSWRTVFLIFGGLGAIWASAFWWWYRDTASAVRGKSQESLPWSRLVASRSASSLESQLVVVQSRLPAAAEPVHLPGIDQVAPRSDGNAAPNPAAEQLTLTLT